MSYLTEELLEEFDKNGYIVIENVLNNEQIENARNELHDYLIKYKNISHENILSGIDTINCSVRKKGAVSELFYSKFKMDIQLDEKIYMTFKELHKFIDSKCLDVVPYFDRVCWRLPDHIVKEGGLKLHIDRNPWTNIKAKKIRNVQSFISLTDHYNSSSGGLCVVSGFHKKFKDYFTKSYDDIEANKGGEFYRMNGKEHTNLHNNLEPVIAPAGSLVIWHNDIPHATCENLISYDTREVIYLSYLPTNYKQNINYWKLQANNFIQNIPPPSYNESNNIVDRDYDINILTEFQKKLIGIK
jgi:ectoine hydroxylase-related dioxygenase (phytanoyl-CoA dioxygenase family)